MNDIQANLLSKITPQSSLREIQDYLHHVFHLRGFDGQIPQDKMLLLLEEAGELAKAIRKCDTGMGIDTCRLVNYTTAKEELADVFIVLLSLCDTLKIDLFQAFYDKETVNLSRHWSTGSIK